MELFTRGEAPVPRTKRHPILFWKKEQKTVPSYRRLVVLLKMKPHRRLPPNIDTDDVFIKVFKDIPQVDLEMVLPGTTLQMPLFQKGKMGVSLIGSFGYAFYLVGWQVWAAIKTLLGFAAGAVSAAFTALWGPVILLAGYGYKQWYGYQFTRQSYAKMLSESLYYQNLGNNAGVLTQLIDDAEEQECRETILAYFFLWRYAGEQGWTGKDLDDYVELYLEGKVNLKVDFEIGDALDKLHKLGIVERVGDRYRAVPLPRALEVMDGKWDNLFKFANPEPEGVLPTR
jgi:hypothetical protein